LTSDDPLPKAAINSGDGYIEIEFRSLDCKLPRGTGDIFATGINGKLAEKMDIKIEGSPPRSRIRLTLAPRLDYDYIVFERSPSELEILLTLPDTARPQRPMPKYIPAPPEIRSPPVQAESENRITSIKYFRSGNDSDKIVFTFEGIILEPEISLLDFPRRIEMELPSMRVELPVTAKNGAFGTRISGRLIDEMEVYNPNAPGEVCVIRFNTRNNSDLKWDIESIEPGKLALNIRPDTCKPGREWMLQSLRRENNAEPKPETRARTVSLPPMKLEVNWPANKDIILEKINTAASRLTPGAVAELPIDLKLYINAPTEGSPYPGLQQ
jgi:hypothetical protein